jgi:hypothetical protein
MGRRSAGRGQRRGSSTGGAPRHWLADVLAQTRVRMVRTGGPRGTLRGTAPVSPWDCGFATTSLQGGSDEQRPQELHLAVRRCRQRPERVGLSSGRLVTPPKRLRASRPGGPPRARAPRDRLAPGRREGDCRLLRRERTSGAGRRLQRRPHCHALPEGRAALTLDVKTFETGRLFLLGEATRPGLRAVAHCRAQLAIVHDALRRIGGSLDSMST